MAINFIGDTKEISKRQLEFICDVLNDQGYKSGIATVTTVGNDGDNYMANVKRISLESSGVAFKMIAKIAPQNEMLRFLANTATIFKNEHVMYTQVLPKLVELQKNANVPEKDLLRYAVCYSTLLEPLNEVILLEDLNVPNYKILDRFQSLSDQCIKSVLKNLATLHSLSYVLKKLEPEMYAEMKNSLIDFWVLVNSVPDTGKYFQQLEAEVMGFLDNNEHKKLVKGIVSQAAAMSAKLTNEDVNSKHAVIQQGDPWTNNIMFKIEGNKGIESIMIDYQISKESSPVYDVYFFIFNCTDHDMRSKHFYKWIDYYHDELDKSLSNFSLEASSVYPKEDLNADLKRYGKVMLGLLIVSANMILRKSENVKEIKKSMDTANIDEITETFSMSATDNENVILFKKRLAELIDSFLQFDLL